MLNLTFRGRVESGEGLATHLGCPTANIAIEQGVIIPRLGVYVGETELNGYLYPSLICINDGRTGSYLKMEVHFLGVDQTLRNRELKVTLFERTRDLVPFENEEQMSKVIANDIEVAKKWFLDRGISAPKKLNE